MASLRSYTNFRQGRPPALHPPTTPHHTARAGLSPACRLPASILLPTSPCGGRRLWRGNLSHLCHWFMGLGNGRLRRLFRNTAFPHPCLVGASLPSWVWTWDPGGLRIHLERRTWVAGSSSCRANLALPGAGCPDQALTSAAATLGRCSISVPSTLCTTPDLSQG